MSEVSQGPGWWLASDGRWYPPEQAPGYVPRDVAPDAGSFTGRTDAGLPLPSTTGTEAPGFGPPSAPGGGVPPAYGYPPQQPPSYYPYAPNGYYPDGRIPYPMGPMVQARQTNPLAVASLVCACVGIVPFLGIIGVILGFVFGLVAKGQIKRTGGVQEGNGLATAGIIISVVITTLWIILWIVLASSSTQFCTNGNC